MKHVTNSKTGRFSHFEMTEGEYQELCDDNLGLCASCGETRDCCEPDAQRYECEACEKRTVYGSEYLMVGGHIRLVEFVGESEETP